MSSAGGLSDDIDVRVDLIGPIDEWAHITEQHDENEHDDGSQRQSVLEEHLQSES
jgi:hypothetical protein